MPCALTVIITHIGEKDTDVCIEIKGESHPDLGSCIHEKEEYKALKKAIKAEYTKRHPEVTSISGKELKDLVENKLH